MKCMTSHEDLLTHHSEYFHLVAYFLDGSMVEAMKIFSEDGS